MFRSTADLYLLPFGIDASVTIGCNWPDGDIYLVIKKPSGQEKVRLREEDILDDQRFEESLHPRPCRHNEDPYFCDECTNQEVQQPTRRCAICGRYTVRQWHCGQRTALIQRI